MKRSVLRLFVVSFVLMATVMTVYAAENPAVQLANRDGARHRNIVAQMEKGNVDLLMIGDSITHYWETAGKEVWNEFYGKRNALNFGIGGDQTQHVLWRLANSPLDKIAPKLTVVMIGTNNIGRPDRCTPEQTVEGIVKIIDVLREKYPKTKILLLEVFPRDEQPNAERRVKVNKINDELNKIYGNDKVKNVQLFGIGDLFLDKNDVLPKSLMPDFLHPNAKGYRIWAEAIEPIVAGTLDPLPAEAVATPRDKDKWWMDRFNQKNDILKKGDINVLMLGDSITHGWEGQGREVWSRYYGKMKPINLGIGGDRTQHVIWRLQHYDFSKVDPKLAVLLIGVNNASSSKAENIAMGNRVICQILHEKFPKLKIIVLHVFPWGNKDEKGKHSKIRAINDKLPSYLRDMPYVTLVDINRVFLDKEGNLPANVMPDYLHPNAEGYERWGNALDGLIQTLAPSLAP